MHLLIQQAANQLTQNIRALFLIDGLGAIMSAFLLGIVLVQYEPLFGMPRQALYVLAFIPCVFAAYDASCYFLDIKKWVPAIKIIAIANLAYCCISIGYVFQHFQMLTLLGLSYFVLELLIVVILVLVEFRTAAMLTTDTN